MIILQACTVIEVETLQNKESFEGRQDLYKRYSTESKLIIHPKHHIHISSHKSLRLACVLLGHGVQRTSVLEPFDLGGIVCMGKLDVKYLTILGVYSQGHWLANFEFCAQKIDL